MAPPVPVQQLVSYFCTISPRYHHQMCSDQVYLGLKYAVILNIQAGSGSVVNVLKQTKYQEKYG